MLERLIRANVENVKKGSLSELVVNYYDAKSKYAFLKNRAVVKVELVEGKMFELDITDYIFGDTSNEEERN